MNETHPYYKQKERTNRLIAEMFSLFLLSILKSLTENVAIFLVKAFEIAAVERLSDLLHQIVVEIQIVRNGKLRANDLLRADQMANIGAAVVLARGTLTSLLDGAGISRVLFVGDVHLTLPGEEVSVTRVTRGHDAVEEIDTVVNCLQNIAGSTNAHQIARLILGHVRLNDVDDAIHILGGLSNRQAANGIAR